MNSIIIIIIILVIILTFEIETRVALLIPKPVCDLIDDFGAVGDNKTDDTVAIQSALKTCLKVIFRAHHTFLLRPVEIISNRHLQIDGNLAAWRDIATWPNSTNKKCSESDYTANETILVPQKEALLYGIPPLNNIIISGNGIIDGQGWRWWPLKNNTSHGNYWHNCRPQLLYLGVKSITKYGAVENVDISGVTFKDSPFWTIAGRGLNEIKFHNVKVITTGCGYDESPNTDGFNLQGENIIVEHSFVRNGDDCVPIFPPSRNVFVHNVTCTCGNPPVAVIWPASNHAGPSGGGPHGRFFAGDIDNVTFDEITLQNTSSGLAIKSLSPFIGTARNIQFTNLNLKDVRIGIAINFFQQGNVDYVSNTGDMHTNVINENHLTRIVGASASSVLIENVTGTVTLNPGHIKCMGPQPCNGIQMVNVRLEGSTSTGYSCMNVHGTYKNSSPVPCF